MQEHNMLKIINRNRIKSVTLFLTIQALFISQHVWAEAAVTDISTYKDNKTGVTLVIAETTLTGRYSVIQPAFSSPVTGLVHISTQPILNDEQQKDDKGREQALTSPETQFKHKFAGILRDPKANELVISLNRPLDNHNETLRLDLAQAKKQAGAQKDFESWVRTRTYPWFGLTTPNANNRVLETWIERSEQIYGTEMFNPFALYNQQQNWRNRNEETDLSSLAVFGGQSAIRETLQTQLISDDRSQSANQPLVDIKTINGVEVRPHPYADMLKALQASQPIAPEFSHLARYIPADRLMIFIREPKRIAHLFNKENQTFDRLSPLLGNGFIDNALLERYAARFGLTTEQLVQWFSGNNVEEIALFTPDVFFLDSTDITAIIRLKENAATPFQLAQMLPQVILPIKLPQGDTFYFTNRNNLLLLSTNESELERALNIADNSGKGSLTETDEFKVMSYKLPLKAQSAVYVYFSDPFIRRLTGPEVKIGQLRRAIARHTMETITSIALLYRLDHGVDPKDIATLIEYGYLSKDDAPTDEYSLGQGVQVVSKTWGTLNRLKTLADNPVTQVTAGEQQAYQKYRDRYTDFWREFFDPIAVRADMAANGNIALETFILPLIDNSLYNGLKETLGSETPVTTNMPVYNEKPLATLAFNIPDKFKEKNDVFAREFGVMAYGFFGLFEILGDTAVFSIQDSDPVVQAHFPGLTAFDNTRFFGMGGSELIAIPVIASYFTRPVDFAIEVTDEQKAKMWLRNYSVQPYTHDIVLETVYDDAKETLFISWTAFGLARMEFSATVSNGWLHISNHPWTPVVITANEKLTPNHAAIFINASQLHKALPQFASLAQSNYRSSVYTSAAELMPWILAYQTDANAALTLQKNALGRGTPLPPEVSIDDKNNYKITPYGSYSRQKTAIMPGASEAVPLLQSLSLWLRFEDDGLRSRVDIINSQPNAE